MNQTQLKYARSRAEAAFNRLKTKLRDDYTVPAVTLNNEDRRKALNSRKFKVRPAVLNRGWEITDYIEFTEESAGSFDKDGHDVALKQLKAQYEDLMDQLILGDHQEALKLLRAFEGTE